MNENTIDTAKSKYFLYIAIAFVALLMISNTVAVKLIGIGPFVFAGAIFIFPLTYIFGDILTEVYGYRATRKIIWSAFVALIVMPIVSVLLLVSVIGIPLGVLGLIGFVGAALFSWLIAPVLLGSLIYRWIKKGDYVVNWKTILLGALAFFILGLIPVLGSLVQCAFIILTFGALLKLKWQLIKEWR